MKNIILKLVSSAIWTFLFVGTSNAAAIDPGSKVRPAILYLLEENSGDSLSEAVEVSLDFCSTGETFSSAADEDWFQFTLQSPQQLDLTVAATSLSPPSAMDTTLSVYNSSGTIIAYNDDANNSTDSEISSLSLGVGTYYVMTKEYGSFYSTAGPFNYQLCIKTASSPDTSFDITLEFSGAGFTIDRQVVFQAAAQKWTSAISAGVSDRAVGTTWSDCDGNAYTVSSIDDLYIQAKIEPIDGLGGILGSAGPRYVRTSLIENQIPISGCMSFDSADIANMEDNGIFAGVILHEMGHVLGIGTVWNSTGNTNCPANFAFTGANAITEWTTLGGTGILPIEDQGGSGTQCGHWDEGTFDSELMTGWVDSTMQMSRLTIGSLKDLQYVVDYNAADAYNLPPPQSITSNISSVPGGAWEVLLTPIPVPNEAASIIIKK